MSDFDPGRNQEGRRMNGELCRFAAALRGSGTPFLAVSIGGNSTGSYRGLRSGTAALLALPECRGLSTRLRSDLPLAALFCGNVTAHPDIVLAAGSVLGDLLKEPRVSNDDGLTVASPPVVAVNLGRGQSDGPFRSLLDIAAFGRSPAKLFCGGVTYDVVYSHNSAAERRSVVQAYPRLSERPHFVYSNVVDTLQFIRDCRLVISYRLHMAIAGLALDSSALFFNPRKKARLFCEDASWLSGFVQTRYRGVPATMRAIGQIVRGQPSPVGGTPSDLHDLRRRAYLHFDWMDEVISHL